MPAPANDTCATATVVTTLPFSETVDVTEATHGPDASCITDAEHTIFYRWTAAAATPLKVTYPDDRGWGTILTIYTGACASLTEVLCQFPATPTVYFVPTIGVPYTLQISLYDGVIPAYPSAAVTVGLALVASPSTPVLAGVSTTGRTVTLTWSAVSDATAVAVERSLDGTTWTAIASAGPAGPYHDRNLASATLYYHRVRGSHPTLGFGAYSNVVATTTLAATVGVVQYGFAIGGTSSFGRMQQMFEDGSGAGYPPTLEVNGVCQLWGVYNQLESQPGGPGTTIYSTSKVRLQYQLSAQVGVTSDYVLATEQQVPVGPSELFQVQYRNPNNRFDLWGKLGSADTLTGTHRADGFLTLTLNDVVIVDLQNIALGTPGTPGWSNVKVHPAGTLTSRAADGSGIDQNGGMSHFFLGTSATAGAHDVYDYTFATMTDDELFGVSGPWLRFDGTAGSSTQVPTLWSFPGGDPLRLSNSSEATGFALGWMTLKPTALITPPDLGPPDGGGGGEDPDAPPYVAPSYALDERIIRRLRRAPHVAQENVRVFYRKIELDLERGVGLPSGQGADPLVMLRLSRDGGHTWSEPLEMSAGKIGVYTQRVIARRLGAARDTVFEVTVSDPVAWALVNAWLDLEAGTS